MNPSTRPFPWRATLAGGLAGAAMVALLTAVFAQQTLTVRELRANPKAYVGNVVEISGLAYNIRSGTKLVAGRRVPSVKLNLYETDAKGRKGDHYVYVHLPASDMKLTPAEGQAISITGPLKWPYEIAAIDP